MKKLIQIFQQMFQQHDGQGSGMRAMSVLGVLLILAVWAYLSLLKFVIQDIPDGVVVVLVALITGKVISKQLEKKDEPTSVGQGESGDDTPTAV